MLQPMLPFLRPKFSSNFKKKERKKQIFVGTTDRPTDGQTDRRTHMDYFTLYHFVGGNFHVSSLPPSRRASSPAGVVATTHPYVRSNVLPSVGGPGGDRLRRSRYLTPSGATILLLDVRTSSNRSSVFLNFEESK